MNIGIDKKADKTILTLQEERIDAHNSAELKDYLLRLLENGAEDVVVNLQAVRFIDSSGLGALLSGYKNANLRQRRLVLAGLQPRVQSMFELTRLHRVFDIYPNLQEVLADDDRADSANRSHSQ